MAPTKLNISDEQRFALIKLRRSVMECLNKPYHDDQFLLRWLRARKWDPAAAEKMLRASLKWREEWEVDSLNTWDYPDFFNHFYPSGQCGFDKEGAPIIIIPFHSIDIWGILHSVTKEQVIKFTVRLLESHIELARQQAKIHGLPASQLVGILDLTDFNIKQYAWRPAAELVIALLQIYEASYPEILKVCFIINAPKVFALAFSVVKKFLHEETINKIRIYKNNPAKWQPALLDQIDASQLPACFGGLMRDPDGNPRCETKVKPGGKVPKSWYIKKQTEKSPDNKDYTLITVKKGEKISFDFIAPQEGYILKWGFYSDEHDIKFGVHSKDLDGKLAEDIAVHRVACHQTEEIGFITCPKPATYTVIFDNSYSFLRSKKIHYSIEVAPPLEIPLEVKRDVEE